MVPLVLTPKGQPEYAHVASLDGSDTEYTKFPRQDAKRYGGYVARAPPSFRRTSTHTSARLPGHQRHLGEAKTSKSRRQKRLAVLDPLMEESVQRSLSQQNRLSCIMTPTKTKPNPRSKPLPPRNPSRQRSLSRFTKELERYCVAASTNGRSPLPVPTPTVSESPTTLNTVIELVPYHRQFKTAGLAVTSREQMSKVPKSTHARFPGPGVRRMRCPTASPVQVDGSTVTPSEQESVVQEPPVPVVPEKGGGSSANIERKAQALPSTARPGPKSLLPWFRKNDTPNATKVHSGRKISRGHIHPSQSTPAEPLLTPLGGIIDSYFDTPEPDIPQDGQPSTRKISLSSHSDIVNSPVNKPLPKQPPIERRPIPERNERRHMDNTAQWPTAGVLIHDKTLPADPGDKVAAVLNTNSAVLGEEYSSIHSWTTEEDGLAEDSKRAPEVPPKEPSTVEDRPEIPPKITKGKQREPQSVQSQPPRQFIEPHRQKTPSPHNDSQHKPLPVPTIIAEPQISQDKTKSRFQEKVQARNISSEPSESMSGHSPEYPVPQLPVTWQAAAQTSASFEKALDAVIQKLDAMEERRQYERKLEIEEGQKALVRPEAPVVLSSGAGSKPSSAPRPQTSTLLPESGPSSNDTAGYSDHDINDKDVLLGLKMAICAACDEDLDAWIRIKTGLRLRRFLADLKAFESVSKDRKPLPQPLSRQIRRNATENYRLQAEKERRRRSMKKTPWTPCFGADGQASLSNLNQEF